MNRAERGFTLIELLVTISIVSLLLTLGASSLRGFWFRSSLNASVDETKTQLRQAQTRATAESHPLTYGFRFRAGEASYSLIRIDPTVTTGSQCTEIGTRNLESGVSIVSAVFADGPSDLMTACSSTLPGFVAGDELVFFYSRGSATPGTITLDHSAVSDPQTLTVLPLTGRVDGP